MYLIHNFVFWNVYLYKIKSFLLFLTYELIACFFVVVRY